MCISFDMSGGLSKENPAACGEVRNALNGLGNQFNTGMHREEPRDYRSSVVEYVNSVCAWLPLNRP